MVGLIEFLESNVLTWVEWVTQGGDLTSLTHAAKDFRSFLGARAKYQAPVGKDVQIVKSWSTDLIRLIAKFGKRLLDSPQSVHWLVPPFGPKDTALAKRFGNSPRGISVSGLSTTGWDDQISCNSFRDSQATAIASADGFFAIGLDTKTIIVHSDTTYQETARFQHDGRMEVMLSSGERRYLIYGGRQSAGVWSLNTGVRLRHMNFPQGLLSFAFTDDDTLTVITKGNTIAWWILLTDEDPKVHVGQNHFDNEKLGLRKQLVAAAFSLDLNMLTVFHRGRPISLFDLAFNSVYGCCERDVVK